MVAIGEARQLFVFAVLLTFTAVAPVASSPGASWPPREANSSAAHMCECVGECGFHLASGIPTTRPWCMTSLDCGLYSTYGNWKWCDARGVERRRANDGQFYNEREFGVYYGEQVGSLKWRQAALFKEMRITKDNYVYTASAFRQHLKSLGVGQDAWVEEWAVAQPEQLKSEDGNWHPWSWYVERHGPIEAWKKWYLRNEQDRHASALQAYLGHCSQDRRRLRGSSSSLGRKLRSPSYTIATVGDAVIAAKVIGTRAAHFLSGIRM